MAQEEPLNLKGFWMENSVLFGFLLGTLRPSWLMAQSANLTDFCFFVVDVEPVVWLIAT